MLRSGLSNGQTGPYPMDPAFCYKSFPALKSDKQFQWPRNQPYQLSADHAIDWSSAKKSSTKIPEYMSNTFFQPTLHQDGRKFEEHNVNYFSSMPSTRPKSRRFSMTYVALIARAILQFPEKRLTLSQIYHVIETTFPEFAVSRVGWKNTVRHNLSLHDCFVKGEVSANGKSCYWHIHPAYITRFSKGDFRKRPSRENSVSDERKAIPRVRLDRPYTLPYAFGGADSRFEFPYAGESHSVSQVLQPAFYSNSASVPRVTTTAHPSTEWLREYKPYPYYYLFSPKSVPLASQQREKRPVSSK